MGEHLIRLPRSVFLTGRAERSSKKIAGLTETKRGLRRDATPKGDKMKVIKELRPDKGPTAFIRDGVAVWTPRHANTAFQHCRYEKNRDEKRGKSHIDALCRQMQNGEWLSRSPLDFALLPDGKLILVNGHHRLLAQVQSGQDIEWQIIIHDCADMDEVRNLFWRFDTVIRKRSTQNVLAGVDAAESLGLSKTASFALVRASVFIESGMVPTQGQAHKQYTPAEKLRLMSEWADEAAAYELAVSLAPAKMRRKLYIGQVMGVALITYRAKPTLAKAFWEGMAKDDGLKRGDPRKTLLDFLRDTHGASTGLTATAVACARAWSAWCSERELGLIRVGRSPVRISGSNFTVAP